MTAVAFALAAALYTGFQWTVRIVVYPQFAAVPRPDFPAYERSHQRRVTYAVGPLFTALGGTAVVQFVAPPAGVSRWWAVAGGACVAAVLLATAVGAVPLHRRLSEGYDVATHRRLLRVDTVRLVAAVGATALGVGSTVIAFG